MSGALVQEQRYALACSALALALGVLPRGVGVRRLEQRWPAPRRWRYLSAVLPAGSPLAAVLPLVVAAAAASPVGWALAGPGGAAAAAVLAVALLRRRSARRAESGRAGTAAELADALARMAEELSSGAHPAIVLAGADTDGPRARALLAPVAAASALGDDVPRALRRAAAAHPEVQADVERLAAAWELAERYGIPLADLLTRAQADLRWRAQFTGRVRAQLAGPRATAAVLAALPALGLGLGVLVGADPLGVLRGSALGQGLLVAGVGLAVAGSAWSGRILRGAVAT